MQIINGKAYSTEILNSCKRFIQGEQIGLAIVLVGDNPASHIYVRNKLLRAAEIGIKAELIHLPAQTSEELIINKIKAINEDPSIHGAIIQLPLPEQLNQNKILNSLDSRKDVDGLTVTNVGLLNTWQDCLEPSTPQGCLYLIKQVLGKDISGKKAVVIGRSIIVGRPLSSILVRESCTVTLMHSKSHNLAQESSNADILITAIGSPLLINEDYIKPGACVIDVGITKVNDRILGDVDFEKIKHLDGFVTPVPGGVGPMTVAFMLINTVKAYYNLKGRRDAFAKFYQSL